LIAQSLLAKPAGIPVAHLRHHPACLCYRFFSVKLDEQMRESVDDEVRNSHSYGARI